MRIVKSPPYRHITAMLAFVIMAFFAPADAAAAFKEFAPSFRYAINLASFEEPIDASRFTGLKPLNGYIIYTTKHREDGKNWYRLRLGFFPTSEEAARTMKRFKKSFPEAWVTKVSSRERARAGDYLITVAEGVKGKKTAPEGAVDEKATEELMDRAARAMTGGDYALAVKLYKKVLAGPEGKAALKARELIGLAYERRGFTDRARAEYKAYLILHPEGEGADRVRQRLAGLETATAAPRKKLKERKRRKRREGVEAYGTLSQFYSRDESFTELDGDVVTRSMVSTDLDLNLRKRTGTYDVRSVLVTGYDWDLLNSGAESELRLSRLYVDVLHRGLRLSGRAGRQSQSSGGVLGRFDGASMSYQVLRQARLNLVAGFPVESSVLRSVDTDRYFYGASMDLGTFAERWDLNLFAMEQLSAGIVDRQAVGGEVRYFHPDRSFFTLVDYDTSYEELNIALLVGSWTTKNKTTVNLSMDLRKSPTLSTTNALQGQAADGLDELLRTMSEQEVRSLAMDRTAESRSVSVGATHPLSKRLQLGWDVTVSEVTGTPASGGVAEIPGTGYEYLVSTQLIGNALLKDGDVSIVGLSYLDASTSNTVTLNLNSRYPVSRSFRVNPRFRLGYTKNDLNGSEQLKLRPALKADYYWKRYLGLEFEAGAEWAYQWVADQTDNTFDYFLVAGYRLDF